MNWICSQIGAREHYAIPRALQSQSNLEHLFTDLKRPGIGAIQPTSVTTFPVGGLRWWWKLRRSGGSYSDFIKNGKWFSNAVRRDSRFHDASGQVFFGYDTGFLEAAGAFKERGAKCVVGQMDPGQSEFDLVAEERLRWPSWEDETVKIPTEYQERREAEWSLADRIIVNSDWSKDALISQGVDAEKLVVIPLSYECPAVDVERSRNDVLDVLWLGQVNLRKGIPYLLEAAALLRNEPVRFTIVGPLKISKEIVEKSPPNVEFRGAVPRTEIGNCYRAADVFVLPTISDGFALTQLEAMAHGLPVIATPNCGRVVTDGSDGFVVPIRDEKTLAERILELAENQDKLGQFSLQSKKTASQYSLNRLASDLLSIEF